MGRLVSMGGDKTTFIVELGFQPSADCARERLEDVAADVADTLDENTSDAVLGSAVSVKFDPPEIEVSIEIEADTPSELHTRLAEVSVLLEAATRDLAGHGYTETARSAPLVTA